ncbi:hypothetical protein H5410_015227 [Solanum commersonii]|uniref:Uncharacterized protein n=1 Tax=Solanum commersonii TaxID=4109 RepID=A0A9J5ZTH8_SOLCO|nr:hypothetical protein H5410_015227 [Solanum commersonii]
MTFINYVWLIQKMPIKLDKNLASFRKKMYSFKAQGHIYHDLPSLIPNNDKPRAPYPEFFLQLKEHTSFQNLEIRIAANALLDQRVYNKPLVD